MKHLFVLRHGEYDSKYLNVIGTEQIKAMAEYLKEFALKNPSFYLISSPMSRTIESSQIIADALNLNGFLVDRRLFTDDGILSEEMSAIDELIAPFENKYDTIALMTHYGAVKGYPEHFAKTRYEQEAIIERPDKGKGIHIDLIKRTYTTIPR